jgi:hypothetical protein
MLGMMLFFSSLWKIDDRVQQILTIRVLRSLRSIQCFRIAVQSSNCSSMRLSSQEKRLCA